MDKLENEYQKIQTGIKSGRLKTKHIAKIERRIGRWQGRYPKADRLIEAELIKDGDVLSDLKIDRRMELLEWAEKANGCYLLRTNLSEENPKKLCYQFFKSGHLTTQKWTGKKS